MIRSSLRFCAASPAVSCAKWTKENAHEHTGSAEAIRTFPAQWLYGLYRAPRRNGLCCLRTNEIVHWTDLKGEALLLSQRDPGHEIHDMVVARLASPVDRPKMVRHDISRENIKSLVGAGFGIGLTIEASLGASFAGVTHREVRDGNGPTRVGHSGYWRQDNKNPALAGFLKLLRERYPSPST